METDDALAIERFKLTYKPFVAFSIVCTFFHLGVIFMYPTASAPVICAMMDRIVTAAFRWYMSDFEDQRRVRWIFGWMWVLDAGVLAVFNVYTLKSTHEIDHICVAAFVMICMITMMFFNIISVPYLCRMIAMFEYTFLFHFLPIVWPSGNNVCFIVAGMLVGEIIGRLWMNRGRNTNAFEEEAANKRFESSFKTYATFSIVSILVTLCVIAFKQTLIVPASLCVACHIAVTSALWPFLVYLPPERARVVFGWWSATIMTFCAAGLIWGQQEQLVRDLVDTTGTLFVPALFFHVLFLYHSLVGTSWLARWTMLLLVTVSLALMSVSSVNIMFALVGGSVIGEITGYLYAHFQETTGPFYWLAQVNSSIFLRWWSLTFEDEAKETAYVAKRVEEFYRGMSCSVGVSVMVLATSIAFFPTLDMCCSFALPFLAGLVLVHDFTERTAPPDVKTAHCGIGLIFVSLLSIVVETAIKFAWGPAQDMPPVVVGVFAFYIALVVVIGKLACLPEHHRQAIHFILLTGRIAISWSTVGRMTDIFMYVTTVPIAELVAYTVDYWLRLNDTLKEKEKQVKLALHANLYPSCITDGHMNVKYINAATTSTFGYREQELVGQHMKILMTSMTKHHDVERDFHGREVAIRHKDGHILHLRATFNKMDHQSGFIVSLRDITQDQVELERNMLLALETTFSPIAMVDSRMMFTYVNEATCTIFGYTSRELVGKDIGILMDEETRKKYQALVDSFGRTENGDPIRIFGHEIEIKHKEGHMVYLRVSVNIADDGKVLVSSFEDMSPEVAQRVSKRKRKENSLLRSLFTSIPGTAVIEVSNPGPNQKVESLEAATETFIGYNEEEWKYIQFPITTIVSPGWKIAAEEAVDALRKGKPIPMSDLEATHRDGHMVWLRLGKASRRLENGNELLVIHDVTADVHLRELRDTMAAFKDLPDYLLVTTDMMSYLAVDGDVFGITGYTAEEFMRLSPRRFLSPRADGDQVMTSFGSITDSAKPFNEIVIQHVHKDGHTLHLRLCHGSRVIGTMSDGRPKILAVFRDMTKTVVEQHQALAKHDVFSRRMKCVPAMVYDVVSQGMHEQKLQYVSPNCRSIYGLTDKEMMASSSWMSMIHPDDIEVYKNSFAKSMATLRDVDLEFRIIVGGKTKFIHSRASPRRERGRVVWTGVLQDMTMSHERFEVVKKTAVQKGISKRFQLTCVFLSHAIRNQLYPQSVVLEEMKEMEGTEWEEYVEMLLSANSTVDSILHRVVALSKWESGDFHIDYVLFPAIRLFKAIAEHAEDKGAVVKGLDKIEPTWFICANEELLINATSDLISNATKFGGREPMKVTMALEQVCTYQKAVIMISVTDYGHGMTPAQLRTATVPFGQLNQAGKLRYGTGLGLPLAKGMIELGHKGTLHLASEGVSKGTTATIRVPVVWVDRRQRSRQDCDPLWWVKVQPGATVDILVVDDVKLNRMVTTFSAKKLGLTFHEASDGAEAVERMRNNKYSLVFMDHQMPGMNGATAIDKARANGYTLPIVMTSGNTFEPCEEAELKRRGVTAFLSKLAVPGTRHAMKRLHEIKQKRSKV